MKHVQAFWHPKPSRQQNIYVAFQTKLHLNRTDHVVLHLFGCDMYRVYLAGEEVFEGPARFIEHLPEYDICTLKLEAGEHVLTVVVHYYGVATRMTSNKLPPFLQVRAMDSSGLIPLIWVCQELDAYLSMGRRINGQLGWAELCDTRLLPDLTGDMDRESTEISSHNMEWLPVAFVEPWCGMKQPEYHPNPSITCRHIPVNAEFAASGTYMNRFGYEKDDPPVRFLLRDLHPSLAPDGVWYRFDFGNVGLYRPIFTLEVPEGAVVETGYSEFLTDGRVIPVISLSASSSCHMDRFIARGGRQVFSTFSARGFRYLEIHIAVPPNQVVMNDVTGLQRSYYGTPIGRFTSSDPILDKIWMMCVDTLQSCSEDALTDTPTRERGQWLGDAVAVGMETLSVAYGDLSLIRRSLEQAALCRRDDGMIVGCYPGQIIPVTSYAMLWVKGCMRYYGLTGDYNFIQKYFHAANDVVDLYLSYMSEDGIVSFPYWDFVDWGHMITRDDVNIALNVLVWSAVTDLAIWAEVLGEADKIKLRITQRDHLEAIITGKMITRDGLLLASKPHGITGDEHRLGKVGYHANVLALRFGLFRGEERARAVEYIKRHMLNCFPNRQDAPRLSHPGANHPQLITPYFGHYALTALLEEGETDFVLSQFRTCWGWMIEQGATTLLEVFDHRWSHCHAWSGCPAWQLSRYMLGLQPIGSGDSFAFEFRLHTGSLEYASGILPIVGTEQMVRISWYKIADGIHYECDSDCEIRVVIPSNLPYQVFFNNQEMETISSGHIITRGFLAILREQVK